MAEPLPNLYRGISRPLDGAQKRFLLLGLGRQSLTMLLLAQRGMIGPMPDAAITSDTGDERTAARETLRMLQTGNLRSDIPISVVRNGDLADDFDAATAGKKKRLSTPPLFVRNDDGSRGRLRRNCTRDYKIASNEREMKRLLGLKKGARLPTEPIAEAWIGFTIDELHRYAPSGADWYVTRAPLIEIGWTVHDCEKWLWSEYGLKVPHSGCRRCPFTDDANWLAMKRDYPEDFEVACQADEAARKNLPGVTQPAYLHDSLRPLREIDFEAEMQRRHGQLLAWSDAGQCPSNAGCGL